MCAARAGSNPPPLQEWIFRRQCSQTHARIDVPPVAAEDNLLRNSVPKIMTATVRQGALAFLAVTIANAAPPAALVSALEYLRDQKSYSWEVINSDPGPVAQQFETRRGTVTTVQQSTAPNMKGKIDRNGDMLILREWPDGLKLETVITRDGTMVTNTPDGWLTDREILTAQAEERLRAQTPTAR